MVSFVLKLKSESCSHCCVYCANVHCILLLLVHIDQYIDLNDVLAVSLALPYFGCFLEEITQVWQYIPRVTIIQHFCLYENCYHLMKKGLQCCGKKRNKNEYIHNIKKL